MAFPLMAGTESQPGFFDSNNQILGTGFYVGSGCLITAGHVIAALQAPGLKPLLVTPTPGEEGLTSVTVIQDLEPLRHDVGVIKVAMRPGATASEPVVPWFADEVSAFDELWALGYPYGLLQAGGNQRLQIRCFRGHAVSNPSALELPTDGGRPARVYELSFQAPRGLSGGPLYVVLRENSVAVAGVIVGNSSQSMVVHSATEVDASAAVVTIVERHESLHLGIAVQASQLLELQSRILSGSLAGHLSRHGALLVRSNER